MANPPGRPTGPVAAPRGVAAERQQQEQALAVRQAQTVGEYLQKYQSEFSKVIPRHLNPERIVRVAQAAITRDTKLLACTPQSLLRGVMQGSILGLEIGTLGDAYLVPFKNGNTGKLEATFIPGYQGLVKLALQSGTVAAVQVGAVYPDDQFDYALGSEPFVKHRPSLKAHDPQSLTAAYVVVKLLSGAFQATIMGKEEIDLIRQRSRAKDSGPWVTDYEQMAIKTVVRRAMKYVPKTTSLQRALEAENRAESAADVGDVFPEVDGMRLPEEGSIDVTPPTKPSTVDAAAEALMGSKPGGKATDVQGLDAEYQQQGGPPEPGSDG
jgi:recombination protein RecT